MSEKELKGRHKTKKKKSNAEKLGFSLDFYRKYVRDYIDCDYLNKLSDKELLWLTHSNTKPLSMSN